MFGGKYKYSSDRKYYILKIVAFDSVRIRESYDHATLLKPFCILASLNLLPENGKKNLFTVLLTKLMPTSVFDPSPDSEKHQAFRELIILHYTSQTKSVHFVFSKCGELTLLNSLTDKM